MASRGHDRGVVNLRSIGLVFCLSLASCAVGAGASIGLHYTTEHSFRVQLEIPLEADLVGAGATETERGTPYVRAALVPQVSRDMTFDTFDVGVRGALGPVFTSRGRWWAPAFTLGGSGLNRKGALDVGVTMDLETPFSNGAACNDLRFNNLLAPQVSVARRVYDVDHPLSSAGGDWDFGIAAGIRHTRFLSCGGGQPMPSQRQAISRPAAR
jgi:hypothetical protein